MKPHWPAKRTRTYTTRNIRTSLLIRLIIPTRSAEARMRERKGGSNKGLDSDGLQKRKKTVLPACACLLACVRRKRIPTLGKMECAHVVVRSANAFTAARLPSG